MNKESQRNISWKPRRVDADSLHEARVLLINPASKLLAAKTRGGDYLVMRQMEGLALEVGDLIAGDLAKLGVSSFLHLAKNEFFEANVIDTHCYVAARTKRLVGL